MTPLEWLVLPVVATVAAAVAVPAVQRRRHRVLPPAQRAEKMRAALQPRADRRDPGSAG